MSLYAVRRNKTALQAMRFVWSDVRLCRVEPTVEQIERAGIRILGGAQSLRFARRRGVQHVSECHRSETR